MANFTIDQIDSALESRILVGLLTNEQFIREVKHAIDLGYFRSRYYQHFAGAAIKHFEQFNTPIGKNIKDTIRANTKPEEADNYHAALEPLLQRASATEGKENTPYLVSQAIRFFKKRELEITKNNIEYFLQEDKVDEAEKVLNDYVKVERRFSDVHDLFDEELLTNYFINRENEFFKMPGDLGRFLGNMQRGWLVGLMGAYKTGKCVKFDSPVLLSDGTVKPIHKVVEGKDTKIVSVNTKGKFVQGVVSDHWHNGVKACYRVKTRTGREVEVTVNHPFLTPNGWKELKYLSKGQFIAVPKSLPFFGTHQLPECKVKVLAYLISDGCITKTTPTFTNVDIEIIKDFKRSVVEIGDTVRWNKGCVTGSIVGPNRGYRSYTRLWLDEIGVENEKSPNKTIPDCIFKLPKKGVALFLKSLFSCDGSIYKHKNTIAVEYASISKTLVYQVQHLLTRFGIVSRIRKNLGHRILISDKENVLKYIKYIGFVGDKNKRACEYKTHLQSVPDRRGFLDIIPKDIIKNFKTLLYSLKFDKRPINHCLVFDHPISRQTLKRIANETTCQTLNEICDSDILWDKIESIKYIGNHETFDLTVADHHNFVCGDMIVHNSWLAMEFSIIGMLSHLNVAFFSLEMTEHNMYERIFKRLSVSANRKDMLNPVFDCKKNQSDECQFARRTGEIALDWQPGESIDLHKNRQYRVCTFCKDHPAFIAHYDPATWFERIEVPIFDHMLAAKVRDKFSIFFKNRFKFKAYPRYTASIEDIKNDLNMLEVTEGWVPDIIVVDYADILKPEPGSPVEGHEKEDRSWIALSQLAGEKKALVIVPTQVTKEGLEAFVLRTKHTARWSGKLGHVDAMLTINQTEEEKHCGIMRVAIMEHRHAEFFETDCCTVLQNLKTAQVHLDSVKTQSHGGE